jgi:hypothetical protein
MDKAVHCPAQARLEGTSKVADGVEVEGVERHALDQPSSCCLRLTTQEGSCFLRLHCRSTSHHDECAAVEQDACGLEAGTGRGAGHVLRAVGDWGCDWSGT